MDGKTQYYLIACGTSKYKHGDKFRPLPSVDTDLERVVKLFTGDFRYIQVLNKLQFNPEPKTIENEFADWLKDEKRCKTDIVIFYYSGHGEYLQGQKHYLVTENTDPTKISQTSLATENLILPLTNEGVKISQILYIIDTCNSQSGAGDIMKINLDAIQQPQTFKVEHNIDVCVIATSGAKQEAQEGVFSKALEKVLKGWNELSGGYIHVEEVVNKINQEIKSDLQQVKNNTTGSNGLFKFFPILPTTLRTWEEKYHEYIENLLKFFKENNHENDSFFFLNSFILSSDVLEGFVLDNQDFKEKLNFLARQPVTENKICQLIAYSEWCLLILKQENKQENLNLREKIESWQNEVMPVRKAEKNQISTFVSKLFKKFQDIIDKNNLRIQIEIQPEVNARDGTGKTTGLFLLNVNLWIESQDLPLGRFAESKLLNLYENDSEKTDTLCSRLGKDDLLSKSIRKARYSLPAQVKLEIEIFLPLDFYQESLEMIYFKKGRKQQELGKEYLIFINSFERYFDEDFREISDCIYKQKEALWKNKDSNPNSEFSKNYYIGTEPLKADLEKIEEAKAIAVWSRNKQKPLVEGDEGHIKISEWKDWPDKIHDLRKQNQDPEITLFWDDLYPKPSRRSRPLNTKVVE